VPLADKHDVRMGSAIIDRDLCVALKGIRCEVCYRACPLTNEAITIRYSLREGDSRHAIFEPVVNIETCVGCGICEERCIISSPSVAIRVKPQALAGKY
jgi:ferredoxin-type protein NapG